MTTGEETRVRNEETESWDTMTITDKDLTRADIQELASRDAVVSFFAGLGYSTDVRMTQTCAAMGITGESLQRQIKHIERVGIKEGGAEPLDIYLIELTSVTMLATQGLARALRNRAGNYLLVLTDDYERIDFVLLERSLPAAPTAPLATKQVVVRPRILTVNRRNPTQVQLRVLRRFTFTEADSDAQYEKLISAYSVADWAEPLFNNRALFSDYYLNSRLPERPEWRDHPETAYHGLRQLVDSIRQRLVSDDRGKTRELFIEPALALLGFKTAPGSSRRCFNLMLSNDDNAPVALCLAYAWNRNLDARDEMRDSEAPDENPAASVVTLLESGEIPWVVLTNGKIWRLYSAKTHSRATNYYEIDLEETLAMEDPSFAFRYFWLLFRVEAFAPRIQKDAALTTASFLDELLEESERYAKGLGERLKDRVFEDIFPHFAEGFIEYLRSQPPMRGFQQEAFWHVAQQLALKQEPDEEFRKQVFQGTLTFLYRLLFLFYAESRSLLPVKEERGYWEHSLTRMKEEIAEKAGKIIDEVPQKLKSAYRTDSITLYDRLINLFKIIDQGSREMNVPFYNGGLFLTQLDSSDHSPEAESARFLLANKIPDRYLSLGLDLLARDIDEKRQDLVAIDYKSLGVRHLGSIYEGLLEFKIRIAQEKMAVVQGKKTEEVIKYSEAVKAGRKVITKGRGRNAEELVYSAGKVYLENDRRERKATGSYYTPDYIVKYIVQNTVRPVLAEKLQALTPRIRQAEQRFRSATQHKQVIEKVAPDQAALLTDVAGDVLREFFDVKALDPAMGSGHFLVECVDFITDRLVEFMSRFRFLSYFFEGMRNTILDEMERQGVMIDSSRLTDVNLLKRHVLKRCIYGVDLNPMAVELAKVSLWLDCFTIGAPLSFLDHHLKCGNSLIGTSVSEVREAIEFKKGDQIGLFGSSQFAGVMMATDLMRHVGELSDVTVEQVKASRAGFRRAVDALAPFKRVMDVYISKWFVNQLTKANHKVVNEPTIEFLRDPSVKMWLDDPSKSGNILAPGMRQVAENALKAAQEKRFFQWELEFPEVFFGPSASSTQAIELKENGGFDAVIGNPPYGHTGDSLSTSYTIQHYIAGKGRADIFSLFLELGIRKCRKSGRVAFITPNSWQMRTIDKSLRKYVLAETTIWDVREYAKNTFQDAPDVVPSIFVLSPHNPPPGHIIHIQALVTRSIKEWAIDGIFPFDGEIEQSYWFRTNEYVMTPTVVKGGSILSKIQSNSIPFGDITDTSASIGVYGYEEVAKENKFISKIPLNKEWKPALRGHDIARYQINFGGEYVHYGRWLFRPRDEKYFNHAKILWQLIRKVSMPSRLVATLDAEAKYYPIANINAAIPVGKYTLQYLLALFNSKTLNYWYRHYYHRVDINLESVRTLPIRRIAFKLPESERKVLVDQVRQLYEENLLKMLLFVEERLAAQPEESDVIHDLLAFLAEQMLDLNKRKQAEQKRFLNWLEGVLKISPDRQGNTGLNALTRKSRLNNYVGDYQTNESELSYEELEDILFKNRSRLGVGLSDVHFTSRLRMEYDKSLAILRPVKEQLSRTDKLIDQVVYKLYSLTEDEIAIVEGSKTVEREIQVSSRRETGRPESIARESDPRVLAEVLDELLRLGPVNSRQLSESLRSRVGVRLAPAEEGSAQRGTKLGPSEADTIKREFGFLGWINRAETLWVLTDEGTALAERRLMGSPTEFARQLCIANDRNNQQVVSRLLARMWELNPEQQGSVIIPQPLSGNFPGNLADLHDWILPLVPKWLDGLEKQMKGFSASVPPEDIVAQVEKSLGERWEKRSPADQFKRLQEVIAERFTDLMFSHIISPADVEIWQSRMDWAGLTSTARNLPSVAGQVWFPVGAFREQAADDFTAIKGLEHEGRTYYCYTPTSSEFENLFTQTLYEGYLQRQQQEQVEYVSLMVVRDWVCFRLRIGNPHFERLLQWMFPKAIQGELPYSMALEVDITPAEKNRLRGVVPVVIDGTTRYIISMRHR